MPNSTYDLHGWTAAGATFINREKSVSSIFTARYYQLLAWETLISIKFIGLVYLITYEYGNTVMRSRRFAAENLISRHEKVKGF